MGYNHKHGQAEHFTDEGQFVERSRKFLRSATLGSSFILKGSATEPEFIVGEGYYMAFNVILSKGKHYLAVYVQGSNLGDSSPDKEDLGRIQSESLVKLRGISSKITQGTNYAPIPLAGNPFEYTLSHDLVCEEGPHVNVGRARELCKNIKELVLATPEYTSA